MSGGHNGWIDGCTQYGFYFICCVGTHPHMHVTACHSTDVAVRKNFQELLLSFHCRFWGLNSGCPVCALLQCHVAPRLELTVWSIAPTLKPANSTSPLSGGGGMCLRALSCALHGTLSIRCKELSGETEALRSSCLILKFSFISRMCLLPVCMYVTTCVPRACGDQTRVLDPLELK